MLKTWLVLTNFIPLIWRDFNQQQQQQQIVFRLFELDSDKIK